MSNFRLKDRKRRFNEIPTVFTDTLMRDIDRASPELKEQFHKIIKAKNDDYIEKKKTTIDSEEEKPPVAAWNNEEEGYMYHQYVSNYQK